MVASIPWMPPTVSRALSRYVTAEYYLGATRLPSRPQAQRSSISVDAPPHLGSSSRTSTSRASRTVPAITRFSRTRRRSPKCDKLSPRGVRTYPKASGSLQWAAGNLTSGTNAADRRSSVTRLADGRHGTIGNAVALCANCHRKMHILNRSADRKKLAARIDVRDSDVPQNAGHGKTTT